MSVNENDVAKLMGKAMEYINSGEPTKALKIADSLEKMRYSGAFEVRATALASMERLVEAIKVLEKGVKKAPGVSRLWGLLGNYYSDKRRYGKSFAAYEKALRCNQVDEITVQYNYALALNRNGDYEKSLTKIKKVLEDKGFDKSDSVIRLLSYDLYLDLQNRTNKFSHVINFFKSLAVRSAKKQEFSSEWSSILSRVAYSWWKLGNKVELNRNLVSAIAFNKHNLLAQWLLREINKDSDYSQAKYFRIVVNGQWPWDDNSRKGFFTTYDVVADNLEEAIVLIKRFEPKEVHESLKIEESSIKKMKKQPKGVYSTIGYAFYPMKSSKRSK